MAVEIEGKREIKKRQDKRKELWASSTQRGKTKIFGF
jgi:hypothetical protein